MRLTYNSHQTMQYLEEAKESFMGIAPVRVSGMQFHLGVWDTISMLMGVETIYYELLDRPEFLHAIMGALPRPSYLELNRPTRPVCTGILSIPVTAYIYTDELLRGSDTGKGPYFAPLYYADGRGICHDRLWLLRPARYHQAHSSSQKSLMQSLESCGCFCGKDWAQPRNVQPAKSCLRGHR